MHLPHSSTTTVTIKLRKEWTVQLFTKWKLKFLIQHYRQHEFFVSFQQEPNQIASVKQFLPIYVLPRHQLPSVSITSFDYCLTNQPYSHPLANSLMCLGKWKLNAPWSFCLTYEWTAKISLQIKTKNCYSLYEKHFLHLIRIHKTTAMNCHPG